MIRRIKNTIEPYIIIFLPIWFNIGRFIPIVETLLTFLSIFLLMCEQIPKRKTFIKYVMITIIFVISGFMYPSVTKHFNHIKALIIMFLAMDASDSELYTRACTHMQIYKNLISKQLVFVLLVNLVFAFFSTGYSEKYTNIWSIKAYRGIYTDPHQAAYHFCVLLIILLWVAHYDFHRYHYLVLLGFEYCTIITGARVPTILALFLGFVFVLDHRPNFSGNRLARKILSILLGASLGLIITYIIMNYTAFGMKMLNSILSQNIDSGRENLRILDKALFNRANLKNKLFGHGTDAIFDYHGLYGSYIWSHNDFTQILCGMGVILLGIYCFNWMKLLIRALGESIISVMVIVLLILVAFYNGLYIHPRLVFVLPLLFMYMRERILRN